MKVSAVGAVIRSYRKASGISQKDLAAMVGISRATLNYLESGRDIEIGDAYDMQAATPEARAELGISDGLVRFSAGLEHADDIASDLLTALEKA